MSHAVVEEPGTGTQQILEPPGFTRLSPTSAWNPTRSTAPAKDSSTHEQDRRLPGLLLRQRAQGPGLDHDEQVRRLSEVAEVRVTDCLDVCERANVIVVQPSPAGRAAGGRPVWLGLVNQPDAAEDIAAWIRAGGPGLAPIPDILTLHLFTRTRS